jgi:hypothetical protein
MADGITAVGGPAISAVAGVPITGALFASFVVSDSSGEPGTQWRAFIDFGDKQNDVLVIPIQSHGTFEFVDTHTYQQPGTYTVKVMIAVPGSHVADDNDVQTQVTVTGRGSAPPTPFRARGLRLRVRENRALHAPLATFTEPASETQQFHPVIDWGDASAPSAGEVRRTGNGRYSVLGAHLYNAPGTFTIRVAIRDATERTIVIDSPVRVTR